MSQLEEQILKQNVLEEHRQVHELQVRIKELLADVERYVAINAQLLEDLERAETQLAKLREQKPVAYVKYKATGGNVGLAWMAIPTGEFYPREGEKLYTDPVPAPAVPSGWNIRRGGDVLIVQHPDIGGCSVQKEPDLERMIPEAILYSLADALLQSAGENS